MKDMLIIAGVIALMALMGFLRTRKLMKEAEILEKGKNHDSEGTGRTDG